MPLSHLDWKNFINRFPDSVACYDQNLKHLYANQAIENEIGVPVSDIIGKTNRELNIPGNPALLDALEEKIRSVFETGKPVVNYTQHAFADQTRFYFTKLIPEFSNQPGQENCVKSVWAFSRDITHLKQNEIDLQNAEKNLRKQNLELIHLNADLDTFFFTVSHDLRGPLSNIQSLIELMKEGVQMPLPVLTQRLEKSTRRLSDVLSELTEILELKSKQEQVEKITLATVLQDVLAEFEYQLQQTDTSIAADFGKCPTLYYSKPYLESLFRNMISNAIKYRATDRKPQLQITAKPQEEYVVLTFQDNGQGFNLEKHEEQVFKPFYQIDGEQDGKGMGLNIVKSILERNGGKIEVKSTPGAGTTFTCYLKEANESFLD
ncbi:PAS domain-containing sensor histidine kinase [Pontibacter liquoris]|uniref:PAS domain-containing sensor histidine kinase n=1 Tax=Pontibacter liquoris TaxID=2905677 RepID=UPI001FA71B2F|nr:PAS domain-containing sensor histidine kinase [Pontibacter liquoris]